VPSLYASATSISTRNTDSGIEGKS
jgi:hypothetical protein